MENGTSNCYLLRYQALRMMDYFFPHFDPIAPRSCFENTDKLSHLVARGAQTKSEVLEIATSKFRGLFMLHMIVGIKKCSRFSWGSIIYNFALVAPFMCAKPSVDSKLDTAVL